MKAAEIVKKYGIVEGECRMISEKKGIIWRENKEGDYEPITKIAVHSIITSDVAENPPGTSPVLSGRTLASCRNHCFHSFCIRSFLISWTARAV